MKISEVIVASIKEHQLLPETGMVVVAVSGGADSLCLLHVLNQICGPGKLYPDLQLHVAHMNHQLRGTASAQDAREIAQLADAWQLPVTIGTADVAALAQQEHRSIEDAARIARYRFLREVAQGQPIAVAHHRDDQVETLLLHWLRGGGIASMVGLQPRQQDIIRPLLAISRTETLAYCKEHQLIVLEDASNSDLRFQRNRIRHELLPLLETMNPGFRETLVRNAAIVQGDVAWLNTHVDRSWHSVVLREQPEQIQLSIPALQALPLSLQHQLLRRASAQLCDGQSPLELRHYQLLDQLQQRPSSRKIITLHLPQRLHVFRRDDILVFNNISGQANKDGHGTQLEKVLLPLPGGLAIPGTPWTATAEWLTEECIQKVQPALQRQDWSEVWRHLAATPYVVYVDADTLQTEAGMALPRFLYVRTRHQGDRIQPLGMQRKKKVKDVLIDQHIPSDVRSQLPLFFSDPDTTNCIWLGGVQLDHRVRLTARTQKIIRLSIFHH